MLLRYSFSNNLTDLERVLRIEPITLAPRADVTPLSGAPVVAQRHGEPPRVELMQWGLVPWWAKDEQGAQKMATAPSETIAERPALRSAYHQRRCLVIADGFYEAKPQPEARQVWRFALAGGQSIMILAGIWDSWRPLGAPAPLYTFSILTTTANPSVARVQNRMPVILAEEHWTAWLNPLTPVERLSTLVVPWPDELLTTQETA